MNNTLIAGAILIAILGVATLLLRVMWRQRKSDSATIAKLQAELDDTTAYLKKIGAAIDADGELLLHIKGDRMLARILATEGRQLLERHPDIAPRLKENDDYLGRVLAAVAEDQVNTIATIRADVDYAWSIDTTYGPLAPYLARVHA